MSGNSGSEEYGFSEDDELFQIGSRCRELRKEKDMLRESQSQSFGLIRVQLSSPGMVVLLCVDDIMGDLGQLFSKLALVLGPSLTLKQQVDIMPNQIRGYEALVTQLKEELREEKMKAKEEAEDLAQEMAELRYQTTCMLEEENKRRASIEQASLQRIAELEAQIQEQQKNFSATVKYSLLR